MRYATNKITSVNMKVSPRFRQRYKLGQRLLLDLSLPLSMALEDYPRIEVLMFLLFQSLNKAYTTLHIITPHQRNSHHIHTTTPHNSYKLQVTSYNTHTQHSFVYICTFISHIGT